MTSQTSFCFAEIGLVTERWRLRLSTEGCIAIETLSRRRAWILRSSRWRDCHTNSSIVRDAAIARRDSGCTVRTQGGSPVMTRMSAPCIPNLGGDALNCGDLGADQKPVRVIEPAVDPFRLDGDNDGVGCEGG
ncbi:MAG TPA: hypothetical protein DDY35_08950 [Acidimicrobiaceae bacterium]|nr:hypothetical protein [Acidimicrobiaceae bacterium]HBH76572.1 hypothetical protein [Acidimicrobiaceae bacterium]